MPPSPDKQETKRLAFKELAHLPGWQIVWDRQEDMFVGLGVLGSNVGLESRRILFTQTCSCFVPEQLYIGGVGSRSLK